MAKRGVLRTYKSYLFREKDPVIDSLRTVVSDSRMKYSKISEESNVSATTLSNWFGGTTKRPQHCTIAAVAKACGKKGIRWDSGGKPKFID